MLQEIALRKKLRLLGLFVICALLCGAGLAQAQNSPRVTGLKATAITHDSITVTWNQPSEPVFLYDFFLKGDNRDFLAGGGATEYTFTGLKPEKKYNIRVRYLPNDQTKGANKWSKKISVSTGAYIPPPTPPVANISVSAELEDGCYLDGRHHYYFDFDPVANAAEYQIRIDVGSPGLWNVASSHDAYDCVGFMPASGATLTFRVRAYDADGNRIAEGSASVSSA